MKLHADVRTKSIYQSLELNVFHTEATSAGLFEGKYFDNFLMVDGLLE